MANTIEYNLKLKHQQALKGFKDTAASAKELAQGSKEVSNNLKTIDSSVAKAARSLKDFTASLLKSATAAGESYYFVGELVSGIKQGLDTFVGVGMNFQKTMSEVAAVGNINVQTDEGQAAFAALEASARSAAATSKFTAIEAAEGLKYFSLAGFEAEQSIAALPGMLNLAAATGADLAFTADLVSDQLSALKMSADEAGTLGDIFAKTVTSSNTSLEQLAEGVKYAAASFASVKYDAADLSAAFGIMANEGTKASMAGTAARAAINRLAAPTKAAADLMEELGFVSTNAQGGLKDFPTLFEDLNQSLMGLSDVDRLNAITEIFGVEAATGMLSLVNNAELLTDEFGNQTSKLRQFRDELRKSEGTAAAMMRTMTDNLAGDVDVFKSNVQELLITVYENIEPALRGLTQFATTGVQVITGMVRGISNILTALRDAFLDAFEPTVTALNPTIETISVLKTQFAQFFSNIKDGGTSMGAFASLAAQLGGVLGGALNFVVMGLVHALGFLAGAFSPIVAEVQNFIAVFNQATDGLDFGEKIQLALSSALDFVTNIDWAASGQAIIATLAQGVFGAGDILFQSIFSIFAKVRNLLPFSDAKEGPLDSLTENGRKIIETIHNGILQASNPLADSINAVFSDVMANIRQFIQSISQVIKGLVDSVKGNLDLIFGALAALSFISINELILVGIATLKTTLIQYASQIAGFVGLVLVSLKNLKASSKQLLNAAIAQQAKAKQIKKTQTVKKDGKQVQAETKAYKDLKKSMESAYSPATLTRAKSFALVITSITKALQIAAKVLFRFVLLQSIISILVEHFGLLNGEVANNIPLVSQLLQAYGFLSERISAAFQSIQDKLYESGSPVVFFTEVFDKLVELIGNFAASAAQSFNDWVNTWKNSSNIIKVEIAVLAAAFVSFAARLLTSLKATVVNFKPLIQSISNSIKLLFSPAALTGFLYLITNISSVFKNFSVIAASGLGVVAILFQMAAATGLTLNSSGNFLLNSLPKLIAIFGRLSIFNIAFGSIATALGLWDNELLLSIPVVGELIQSFEALHIVFNEIGRAFLDFFKQSNLTAGFANFIEFVATSFGELFVQLIQSGQAFYLFVKSLPDEAIAPLLVGFSGLVLFVGYALRQVANSLKNWFKPDYLHVLVNETKKSTQTMAKQFKQLSSNVYDALCNSCDPNESAKKQTDSAKRTTTRIGAMFQSMWDKVALMGSSAMERAGAYINQARLTGSGTTASGDSDKRTSAVLNETDRRAQLQGIMKYEEEYYDAQGNLIRRQTEEYKKLKSEVASLGNQKRTVFQSIAVHAANAANVIGTQFSKAFGVAGAAGNAFVVRIVAGFAVLRGAVVAGVVAIKGMVVALAVANPFVAMIAGAVAFAGLAYAIFANWQTVVSLFQSIPSLIQSALGYVENLISGLFGIVSDFLGTFVSTGLASFVDAVGQLGVDIVNLLSGAFDAVFLLLQGRFSEAGYALIETLGNGLLAGFDFLKSTFLSILEFFGLYLPHSDADQGPLSDLTGSGAAIPKTLGEGIAQGEQALTDAMDTMMNTSFDKMIAGAREKMVGFYEYLMPNNPEQYAGSLRDTFANIFGQLLGDDQYKAAFIDPQKEQQAAQQAAQQVATVNKQALTGLLQQARELTNGRLSEARKQLSNVQTNLKQAAAEYKKYAEAAKKQEKSITEEKARQQSVISDLQNSGNDISAIDQVYNAEKQMRQKKAEFESKMAQAAMAQDLDRRNELLAQAEEIGRAYEQVAQDVMNITPEEGSISEIYITDAEKRRVALKGVAQAHELINQAMGANKVAAEEAQQKYVDLQAEAKTLEGTVDGLKDLKADLKVDFSKPQEAAKQLQAVISQITLQDLDAQLNQLAGSVGQITNGSQRTFDISTAEAQQQIEALNQKYREAGGVIVSTKQSENELSQQFYANIEQARAALQAKQDQWNAMDSAQQQGDAGKALQAETIELHKQIQAAEQLEGQKQLKVEADINQAQQALNKVQTQLDGIKDKKVTVTVQTVEARSGGGMIGSVAQWTKQKALHLSRGMKLNGYGGGDKIPAMLEAGEFVINKASTRMFSELLHAINYAPNTAKNMLEGVQYFNTGGLAMPQMQLPQLQIPQMQMPNIPAMQQPTNSQHLGTFTLTLNDNKGNSVQVSGDETLAAFARSMKGAVR